MAQILTDSVIYTINIILSITLLYLMIEKIPNKYFGNIPYVSKEQTGKFWLGVKLILFVSIFIGLLLAATPVILGILVLIGAGIALVVLLPLTIMSPILLPYLVFIWLPSKLGMEFFEWADETSWEK